MPNRLAHETSPYLQQHAENPVDWYPWGEEALARSKRENRPILLSVGYSACHWCHVMAHESFEDPDTAALMNELFVNVKVDREERPDLDQIYQLAHALLTQRNGGWPLTMFLTPDQVPFFGGTYFPKTARFGLPGFRDLLPQVAAAWKAHGTEIARQNEALLDALARSQVAAPSGSADLGDGPIRAVVPELQRHFDGVEGGLGDAPKFPHPVELGFLLRRGALDGDGAARQMALLTLRKMAEGGIYDQAGGGFARYSVDRTWTIPHFEKMLYDNGPLLRLYAEAWALTREPLFERVARETAAWVMREMQSPKGGYYSTLDADSEHEEGKFYVWTPDEVRPLLTADEHAVAAAHWGLDGPPNFEAHFWHLRVMKPLAAVAGALGKPLAECEALLSSARAKLFAARERRIRPGRDEKILASWNGLMIAGMARAGRAFGEAAWIDSAERAVAFVRETLWKDGKLLATCKDGKAHLNAYLDDHAFLLEGLLELMQARFRPGHLDFARELAEALLARFEDREAGGFFFTSHDHEPLIQRPKPGHDNATPSGNGVAAVALQRLGHLVGEPRYGSAAERTLRLFYPQMTRQASGFTSLAVALEEWLRPPTVAVLRGPADGTAGWAGALGGEFLPGTLVIDTGILDGLPPALDKPVSGDVNAWVCSGVTCLPAITELEETVRACKSRPVV